MFKTTAFLTQSFILPSLIKRVPGISANLVLKSKLSPQCGSVTLRLLNPVYKKGPYSCFFKVQVSKKSEVRTPLSL